MAEKFPRAYVNSVRVDRALMEYVPFETTSIGARSSGQPKGVKPEGMKIDHVGGTTAGGSK